MKTQVLKVTLLGCLMTMGIMGCNNTTQDKANKVEDAKENLANAQQDLAKARQDSANEELKYRQQREDSLKEYNRKIAELRDKIKKEDKKARDKYDEQLNELDKRNSDMEARLHGYKDTTRGAWNKFKYDFNRDMDSLGRAISRVSERHMHNEK